MSKEDLNRENNSLAVLILFSFCLKDSLSYSCILFEVFIVTRAVVPLRFPRLESPTRSLLMEAPKGIQILAEAGDIQAICRNELRLESKDGEVSRPMSGHHDTKHGPRLSLKSEYSHVHKKH